MPLQIRRGTEAERLAMTVPLAEGELLYVTDDQRLYIGGKTALGVPIVGGIQITGYTNEDAMDAAAGMLTSGVHNGITFTYGLTQDTAGRIDASIDLSSYTGSISADLIGSVFSDDSTRLIDGTSGQIILDGTVKGHIVPNDSEVYDLGSGSFRFRDLWLSGTSIHLGDALITSIGSAVNLPAGSLVAGVPIGSGTGDGVIPGSDYKINIVGDDSTLIVNSSTNQVTAAGGFVGDLTGNVIGNVFGNLNGNVSGDVTGNVIGNTTGYHTGDVKGSVVADDSTILVDGVSNALSTGSLTLSNNSIESLTSVNINGSVIITDYGLNIINSNVNYPWNENRVIVDSTGNCSPSTFLAARGSHSLPTSVISGDLIYTHSWLAHDGTDFVSAGTIAVEMGTVNTGNVPGNIYIFSTPNNDVAQGKGLTISESGTGVNTGLFAVPQATLDINGFAKLSVLTAEPATLVDGLVAIANGTTWNPTSTGKQTMVVRLGGAWVQMAVAP